MTADDETPSTALARLEGTIAASGAKLAGQIEALSVKIDLKHEKVVDIIDNVRREGEQQHEFYKSALRDVRDSTDRSFAIFGARLGNVETGLDVERQWTSREKGVLAVLTFFGVTGVTSFVIEIAKIVSH